MTNNQVRIFQMLINESYEEMINSIAQQDFSKAGPSFNDIMNDKIATALEQEKAAIASFMFSDEDDVTDEEIDDAIDELEDDDEDEEDDEEE